MKGSDNRTFTESGEDDLDIDAIFGGGSTKNPQAPAELPFAQPETPGKTKLESLPVQKKETASVSKPEQSESNRIEAVFEQQAAKSLFEKAQVFSYGGAMEEIEDASMTFEELRIAKSDDFPEIGEGKKVSWTVEYGKNVKMISDPKGTTIISVKEEIEHSQAFLDGLKKSKEKSPDCLVKPKVTAQSNGIAGYKGVFLSLEEAEASPKAICLFPARDGKVYELRKTEMGDFIAPKSSAIELSEVRAGFVPALPLIPRELLMQVVSFSRCFIGGEEFEALAHIYWDRDEECFEVLVPRQTVG